MKYEDMSKADRAAVDRAIGRESKGTGRTRPRPSRAEVVAAPGEVDPGGSCSCGEHFATYKAWEKHRDSYPTPPHARYSIDMNPAAFK